MGSAPWRKLWSSVSLSKKVNYLSDQAALFWTWAVPHFSTHGFLQYDPEDLKTIIVPRRPTFTPEVIKSCIQEILDQKLWNAYVFKKGRVYPTMEGRVNVVNVILYDPRWFEMQNIRKDRIAQLPYNIKEMEQIYNLLPECPGYSRTVQDTPGVKSNQKVKHINSTECAGDPSWTPTPGVSRSVPTEIEIEIESEIEIKKRKKEKKERKNSVPLECPHNEIIFLYHEILPELNRILEWTDSRKKTLQARWREKPERQNLEWWKAFFLKIKASDFLTGKVKEFRADLEWCIKPKNFIKILEGKYDGKENRYGADRSNTPALPGTKSTKYAGLEKTIQVGGKDNPN